MMTWCLKPCTCANIFLSLWQRNGAAYHGDSRLDSRDLVPLKTGSRIKKDACFLPHPRHSLSSSEFQALSLFSPIKQLREEKFRKNAVTETGGKEGGGVGGVVFNCNTLLFWEMDAKPFLLQSTQDKCSPPGALQIQKESQSSCLGGKKSWWPP